MARRAPKRARGAKKKDKAKTVQPMLPNIVAGALAVGTEVGRVALRAAQGVFGAAGRFTGRTATSPAELKIPGSAEPTARRDSALPEAELDAIAQARRRESKPAGPAPRGPASRKPLTRSPARSGQSAARRRRRKTA